MSVSLPVQRDDDPVTSFMVAELVGVAQDAVQFVWSNEDGGFTFRYIPEDGALGEVTYLSWVPQHRRLYLDKAVERARWVVPYIRVPQFSEVRPGLGGWWVTSPTLPGESAVSPWAKTHPERTIRAIATGLRRLHDTAPANQCPFTWDVAPRVRRALRCVADSTHKWRLDPDGYFIGWDTERAYKILCSRCAHDLDLVVCHGDPCSPNTIVDSITGDFVGLVDVGGLGVADRWADLAVASWALTWNFGPGWDSLFFEEYGVEPIKEKIDFYRLLWNTG